MALTAILAVSALASLAAAMILSYYDIQKYGVGLRYSRDFTFAFVNYFIYLFDFHLNNLKFKIVTRILTVVSIGLFLLLILL